jgi:putative transposase
VLNRGNARNEVFHKQEDYAAFVKLLGEASQRVSMRLLAYCLMPNHFHLVLWPRHDGDLSRWMQWLMTSHVRRYHRHYHSSGHVWQGRFKAFPLQEDEHLLTVMRYIERNAVRAKSIPVRKVENWPWSSAGKPLKNIEKPLLDPAPVPRGQDWIAWVNQAITAAELKDLRESIMRGRPYGNQDWQQQAAKKLGLDSSLRPRGRPTKLRKK